MIGEEGRPGKKLKKTVKVKKAERPPANPVVDVRVLTCYSSCQPCVFFVTDLAIAVLC